MNRLESQTLGLAGMFQAAVLVEDLAQSGQCNNAAFDCSLDSLFTFDAGSPRDVFGDIYCLHRGFEAIGNYLGGEGGPGSRNVAYYVLSMLKLGGRLQQRAELAESLAQGLRSIERNLTEFALPRDNAVLKIDHLYQQSVSQLAPRIIVRGNQQHLANDDVAARIRTLLLAGIRAAVLWRQLGGSRWRMVLGRRKYLAAARRFLSYH